MKKVCNSCKIEKPLDDFHKDKKGKYGVSGDCKECRKEYVKKYRQKNKEQITEYRKKYYQENKEYHKKYYKDNKEKLKETTKKYYQKNKEQRKKTIKKYHKDNKEQIREYQKKWHQENKEKLKENAKKYYQENKEQIKETAKKWHQENKEQRKEYKKKWRQENKGQIREYLKNRRKTNPLFKLSCNLRQRTSNAFRSKGYSKNTKTQKMLGVDWEVCKAHIERQFTKGMNWDNYGEWHVDHIIPLASATTEKRLKELCHYTNLQPLWASDNLSKSDKIINQQTMLRI